MTEVVRPSDVTTGEFDASLIAPMEQDWEIISSSPLIGNPRDRCYILGDLAVLDPQRPISIVTEEDWQWFDERTAWLNERDDVIVRNPLIKEMAKVDRERACESFKPDELSKIWVPVLHRVLKGEESLGLFPASIQEELIYTDPDRTKRVFDEYKEAGWNAQRRYLDWLRFESPAHVFTLLAALSEIDQDQTLSLMEKSDWQLALEGLAYYRKNAAENGYRITRLIAHLAALKKLTPLFEQLFQQESSNR
ncbi:hypothetical protein A3F02_01160 [Candidatus Curtissbacteria bacterium RIFCSPHIGHO2_12_FULL_38_9b]|uniref:Uncharacterized protein n=1 Tax=Candidatus Curtissbacteria bacterium RIFCSPHIGHO2_12_FULL_38_9b TaxID=1797720 RepID=A0A1F5GTK8_9BACT|nr:MAG: hypothetical protein A3F02_01160 [Candidatus Curtissbacteria bacterium RIFCSPHIGHO2_12_FULL_38_9b]